MKINALALLLILTISPAGARAALLDLFFPPAKWNQQCKDLANDLISQNGIENARPADPEFEKNFARLKDLRTRYRRALAKQNDWKDLDARIEELNSQIERMIVRPIAGLEKDIARYSTRQSSKDRLRAEVAAAQLPGLKALHLKKRRELFQLSQKREEARLRFDSKPEAQALLTEINRLDGDTRGHWLYEQFTGRNGELGVQAYSGKSPFYVYTDGGHFTGYRIVLAAGASVFVQLHSDCRVKQKAYAANADAGSAVIGGELCAHRPEYAFVLRRYYAAKNEETSKAVLDYVKDKGSFGQSPEDFAMPAVDRACQAMYPESGDGMPPDTPAAVR
jgi:hypothetical protein